MFKSHYFPENNQYFYCCESPPDSAVFNAKQTGETLEAWSQAVPLEMDLKNNHIKTISKVSMPFYEPPPRKTSAEIINEARLAIKGSFMILLSFNVCS